MFEPLKQLLAQRHSGSTATAAAAPPGPGVSALDLAHAKRHLEQVALEAGASRNVARRLASAYFRELEGGS